MAYVAGCENDIFVSYAHVDDFPYSYGKDGWVTALVEKLKTRLAQLLGRRDAFSLWMDHQLDGHVRITRELANKIEHAATLLVVLSPGYLASDWCTKERETFFKLVKNLTVDKDRTVFVVERETVDLDEWPEEFRDRKGYRFWVQDREGDPPRILGTPIPLPEHTEYYDELNHLAWEMHKELKRLNEVGLGQPEGVEVPADTSRLSIFLAETTDDLEPLRSKVSRSLEQRGYRVIPDTWLPREPSAFRETVAGHVDQSQLFVQLLSTVAGKKLPDSEETYVSYQHQYAANHEIPILQWRSEELRCDAIDELVVDPVHRRLLQGPAVQAVDIEEFTSEVIRRAELVEDGTQTSSPSHTRDAFVFVDVDPEDSPLADELGDYLAQRGYDVATPAPVGSAEEIRKDLENNLLECDAFIVVYGETASTWVRGRLLNARKCRYLRKKPLLALAVYEGPPEQKKPLGLWLRNLEVIHCTHGLQPDELERFLQAIEDGVKDSVAKRAKDGQGVSESPPSESVR